MSMEVAFRGLTRKFDNKYRMHKIDPSKCYVSGRNLCKYVDTTKKYLLGKRIGHSRF